MRADSGFYAHAVVAVCRKLGVRFSITIRQQPSMRRLIEAIPEAGWTPIEYWLAGGADVAETTYTPFKGEQDAASVRLIVRRVKPTPGSQLALFTRYSYHAFITDRAGQTLELEADHRRHAEIENAIRDLKYGVGLNHLPSGRFAANGAWLAVQVIAHNLARWTARIALAEGIVTTKTLRRRLFRSRRAAHSLCSSAHAPSAGALALGRQLHRRPRPAAGDPAPDLTPLGLADRSTAWRQHACERLPTAVSSCPHARTATVAPCQRHQPLPHPPKRPFRALQPAQPRPPVDSGLQDPLAGALHPASAPPRAYPTPTSSRACSRANVYSPASSMSTTTQSPSSNSPASTRFASSFSTRRSIVRRNGRAPKLGS